MGLPFVSLCWTSLWGNSVIANWENHQPSVNQVKMCWFNIYSVMEMIWLRAYLQFKKSPIKITSYFSRLCLRFPGWGIFNFWIEHFWVDFDPKILARVWDQAQGSAIWVKDQFEETIWARHNTQWQWNKFLKIASLVSRLQIGKSWMSMSLNQTNATNVTMHHLMQGHSKDMWKHTVEKSQTNATSVTMHPLVRNICIFSREQITVYVNWHKCLKSGWLAAYLYI